MNKLVDLYQICMDVTLGHVEVLINSVLMTLPYFSRSHSSKSFVFKVK